MAHPDSSGSSRRSRVAQGSREDWRHLLPSLQASDESRRTACLSCRSCQSLAESLSSHSRPSLTEAGRLEAGDSDRSSTQAPRLMRSCDQTTTEPALPMHIIQLHTGFQFIMGSEVSLVSLLSSPAREEAASRGKSTVTETQHQLSPSIALSLLLQHSSECMRECYPIRSADHAFVHFLCVSGSTDHQGNERHEQRRLLLSRSSRDVRSRWRECG